MSASAATREFLMRFAALLSDKARTDPALSSFAKATAGLESETDQESSLDLSTHPITAHVAPLLDRATADADLVDTIRALTGDLRWYQIFQGSGIDRSLAEGLFAAPLAGPTGFIASDPVRAGLFLLAPNICYPLHSHAAEELYFGLSGRLTLQHGTQGEPFTIDGTSWSVTPSNRLHSLRTGDEPVLLAFIWKGEINAPNWWWAQQEDGSWRRTCWTRTPTGAWAVEREEAVSAALVAEQV